MGKRAIQNFPLCIDLDGTLIATDITLEQCIAYITNHPFQFWRIVLWLCKGRAYLKHQLVKHTSIDVPTLPYNKHVVSFMEDAKKRQQPLYLVTASNKEVAREIATHVGLFSETIASNATTNVKGAQKAEVLKERFGKNQFDYIGNSMADIAVWRAARHAIVVSDSQCFAWFLQKRMQIHKVLPLYPRHFIDFLKSCRPQQWLKNLLLFTPLLTSHQLLNPMLFGNVVAGFCAWSMCAAAVYLCNDICDIKTDRLHAEKCHRPLASGAISIQSALLSAVILMAFGLTWSFTLSVSFGCLLLLYAISTTLYSIYWKHVQLLDVFVLASLYTIRIIGGNLLTGIELSTWLLSFAVFLFLSFAFLKRYIDIVHFKNNNRPYKEIDEVMVQICGIASGYVSVVIFALYSTSERVRLLYEKPDVLLLICPLLLFWITRRWFAARNQYSSDPFHTMLQDTASYLVAFAILVIMYSAI